MEIPCVNGLQQVPEAVPLAHRPNDQLALFDGDVDGRTYGHLRLDGE
jgi:hypothetical protein